MNERATTPPQVTSLIVTDVTPPPPTGRELHMTVPNGPVFSIKSTSDGAIRSYINLGIPMALSRGFILQTQHQDGRIEQRLLPPWKLDAAKFHPAAAPRTAHQEGGAQ